MNGVRCRTTISLDSIRVYSCMLVLNPRLRFSHFFPLFRAGRAPSNLHARSRRRDGRGRRQTGPRKERRNGANESDDDGFDDDVYGSTRDARRRRATDDANDGVCAPLGEGRRQRKSAARVLLFGRRNHVVVVERGADDDGEGGGGG